MLKSGLSLCLSLMLVAQSALAQSSSPLDPYIVLKRSGDLVHVSKCQFEEGLEAPTCEHLWHMGLEEYRQAVRNLENKSSVGMWVQGLGSATLIAILADAAFQFTLSVFTHQGSWPRLRQVAIAGFVIASNSIVGRKILNEKDRRAGLIEVLKSIAEQDESQVSEVTLQVEDSVWYDLNKLTPQGQHDHTHHHHGIF